MAEGGGFEPPVDQKPTQPFQGCTIDHSDTPPRLKRVVLYHFLRSQSNHECDKIISMPDSPAPELVFPLTAHFRVIAEKDILEKDQLELAVGAFTLAAPLEQANVSSKGRYVSYAFSAIAASRDELTLIDASLRKIPGVRMVL